MRRREIITLIGGAVAASSVSWPFGAHAQQPAMPMVGVLGGHTRAVWRPFVAAFNEGLKEAGYVDGQNVLTEYRWAEGDYARLPGLAADLVRRKVGVIAAIGGVNSAVAAKAATSEIPIVFLTGRDPVELGFVDSLNRPGGNLTGVSLLNDALMAKRLELLRELVPNATTVAFLINPNNRNHHSHAQILDAVARGGGQQLVVLGAAADQDFEPAFSTLTRQRVEGPKGVDGIRPVRDKAADGDEVAERVDRRQSMPGRQHSDQLAMNQRLRARRHDHVKYETVLNLKTAKALGIEVPPMLLARADEVIE
jgi:ABC-type uncharacterized transport system substrate-binding protein